MLESSPPLNTPQTVGPLTRWQLCLNRDEADNGGSLIADLYNAGLSSDSWTPAGVTGTNGRILCLGQVQSDLLLLPLFSNAGASAEFQFWGIDSASQGGWEIGPEKQREQTGLAYDYALDTDAGVFTAVASSRTVSLAFDANNRPYRPASGGGTWYVAPMIALDWLGFRFAMATLKTLSAGEFWLLAKSW